MTDPRATSGRLIAVVGPSGVGKDSVMAGLRDARPDLTPVRRTITRAPELGGEDYEAVTVPEFDRLRAAGGFALHWRAHGLFYGIPSGSLDTVGAGRDLLANLSRGALPEAARIFPRLTVLSITASAATLAARLAGRGRESTEDIARRLDRAAQPLPDLSGVEVVTIHNDGTLDDAVAQAVRALYPVRA